MSERERAALPQRRREARANSAIEGIHLTAEEVAFLDLLDEERVPYELRIALADAVTRAGRLVAALKSRKKEQRALTQVWSSLKALNLGPEGRP